MQNFGYNRLEEIQEFLEINGSSLVKIRLKKMEIQLSNDNGKLWNSLVESLKKLLPEEPDDGGYFVMCYFRSSYITGSHCFYLDYQSGEPFLDEWANGVFFSLKSLFYETEDDCKALGKMLSEKFLRILPSEKEEVRRWFMEQIYVGMETVIIAVLERYKRQGAHPLFYGGYMEQLKQVGML